MSYPSLAAKIPHASRSHDYLANLQSRSMLTTSGLHEHPPKSVQIVTAKPNRSQENLLRRGNVAVLQHKPENLATIRTRRASLPLVISQSSPRCTYSTQNAPNPAVIAATTIAADAFQAPPDRSCVAPLSVPPVSFTAVGDIVVESAGAGVETQKRSSRLTPLSAWYLHG